MDCPKCGAPQADRSTICEHCGIVFEKYWKYHPPPGVEAAAPPPERSRSGGPSGGSTGGFWSGNGEGSGLFLPGAPADEPLFAWAKAGLLAVLAVWGLTLIGSSVESNAAGNSFLHLVNLPFHEAGHVLFRPLGEFMTSLGGTLGQLLVPAICFFVFLLKNRDPFGASVALWWLGENFLDIAPYIADARAGVLPLVGGNYGHSSPYGFHDWEYLLTETGLIHMDRAIAGASHGLGSAIMLVALGWGGAVVYRQLKRG